MLTTGTRLGVYEVTVLIGEARREAGLLARPRAPIHRTLQWANELSAGVHERRPRRHRSLARALAAHRSGPRGTANRRVARPQRRRGRPDCRRTGLARCPFRLR